MKVRCRGYEGVLVELHGEIIYLYGQNNKILELDGVRYTIKIDTLQQPKVVIELNDVVSSEIEVLKW